MNEIYKLCECGCGNNVTNEKNRFLPGHHRFGKTSWNKGKPFSNDIKLKISKSLTGKKLSIEHKQLLSEKNKGKIFSENHKLALSIAATGRHLSADHKLRCSINHKGGKKKGSKSNIETRLKLSIANKGKKLSEQHKLKIGKKSKGRTHSQDTKLKLRKLTINRIEIQKLNGEPLMPCIGNIERPCLNKLESIISKKIIRSDHNIFDLVAFFPDGHIPELKLFIEFDEKNHFEDKEMTILKQKDIERQLILASLGYIVFRISEKQWNENKEKVTKDFTTLCQQLNSPSTNQKDSSLTI